MPTSRMSPSLMPISRISDCPSGKTPEPGPDSTQFSRPGRSVGRRRIRAFRASDAGQMIDRQMVLLNSFTLQPGDMARALREARKAALQRATWYDPARHAALLRLARTAHAQRRGAQQGDTPQGGAPPATSPATRSGTA